MKNYTKAVEFPKETARIVRRIAKHLNCTDEEAISKGIGLVALWIRAQKQNRLWEERTRLGRGKKYEIIVG